MTDINLLPGLNSHLSLIVGILVKILLALLTLLSLVSVRQASLMDRVVNVPMGSWFKRATWGFFWFSLIMMILVVFLV